MPTKFKPGPTSHETKVKQLNDFIIHVICENYLLDVVSQNGLAHSERRHSARTIQDRYGIDCAILFRIIYTQWTRGGRTLCGISFKSRWVITPKHALALFKLIKSKNENSTAKEWVKKLREEGLDETSRGRFWDNNGDLVFEEILSKAESKELVKMKREVREHYSSIKKQRESTFDI